MPAYLLNVRQSSAINGYPHPVVGRLHAQLRVLGGAPQSRYLRGYFVLGSGEPVLYLFLLRLAQGTPRACPHHCDWFLFEFHHDRDLSLLLQEFLGRLSGNLGFGSRLDQIGHVLWFCLLIGLIGRGHRRGDEKHQSPQGGQ